MIKAVNVLNKFSIVLFIAILLLVYAYLPVQVALNVEGLEVHKQYFFYYALGAFLLVNILLRVTLHFGFRSLNEKMTSWLTGLIFLVNFYLTTLIGFIGVLNNSTHVRPSSYAYLNYMGPALICIWVVGFILLGFRKK